MKSKLATKDLEIELLNTEMKTAYHTTPHLGGAPHPTQHLLGDTNLSSILPSDLHHTCWVGTIPGANMDLLRSWVSEKMHKSPHKCGTSDIIDEHSTDTILDNLGSLISDLKEKNSNMNVYVCKIVPFPLQQDVHEKIEDYNNHLAK